jgi:Xaa-Pro aminopeptidase
VECDDVERGGERVKPNPEPAAMQYIPREELELRWKRVRRLMKCDAMVVLQKVDLYYLAGTTQDAVLWFPAEGEPVLAVRKSYERARQESAVDRIVPLKSYRELPGIIPAPAQTLGFELDVVPVSVYEQVVKNFPNSKPVDASMTLREARGVKTPYEVARIREAARQLDKAFVEIPRHLREGVPEFEVSAAIEYTMRMAGHQGLSRVRRFNMEMHYGAVSFGDSAVYPHSFDGPVGVRGLYAAVPVMGGSKRLKRGEPVVVDIVGGFEGYIADGTRIYALGSLPPALADAHRFVLDLNAWIEEQLRVGNVPSAIYEAIHQRVAKTPYAANFMGAGENQVRFVAHGVGLELDEFPVIAPKFDAPIEPGVVFAVEPKVFFPGVGGVGIENTYLITESGCERLTQCSQDVFEVP